MTILFGMTGLFAHTRSGQISNVYTAEPLYTMVHYNIVLELTKIHIDPNLLKTEFPI